MNLQENIFRIKQMMGVLNEQAQVETISHTITQPYPNPNWDTVHAFSTKASDSDLEDKVGLKLKSGNYSIDDVNISTYIEGNKIITKANVYFIPNSTNPHKFFTTRGSIGPEGSDYIDRHDKQVSGLDGRLKEYYKSNNVKTFGPFQIPITDARYAYKQTFFAIEGTPQPITPNPVIPNPQTQPATTGTQATTTGGETPTATVQTTGGETPTNPQLATTEFKYPSIDNPFTPKNGDPWKYAYDGTKLIVKNPKGSNTPFNLKDPDYFKNYPGSKLKTQEQLDKAIASIKNAYGKELGL